LFFGCSSGVLAFGLTKDGYARLPLFLGVPFWYTLVSVQWSPVITAAALLSPLLPVALAKPNVGIPILLTFSSRRGALACAAVLLASLLVLPSWPLDWFHNLGHHLNVIPVLVFPGPLLLLALLRWRDQSARLLLLMALMPQRFLYDQVALWLLPRTLRESLALSIFSWCALWTALALPGAAWGITFIYLPALAIVLRPMVMPALRRYVAMPTTH
jgi:hypothetical protein